MWPGSDTTFPRTMDSKVAFGFANNLKNEKKFTSIHAAADVSLLHLPQQSHHDTSHSRRLREIIRVGVVLLSSLERQHNHKVMYYTYE